MTTATRHADSHRTMMAERKQRSRFWKIVHFLGSLKLALVLLATIAIACAVATFYESSFDAKIARAYVYKAPWFLAWLGVLCINLFAVTLTRWPWQRKHLGFVITHYGIITLLTGAVIGSYFGFEGNVTLHRDRPPVSRITTSRSMVQIENPSNGGFELRSFDPALALPSERHPVVLGVPGSPLKLIIDARSENLAAHPKLTASDAPDAVAGTTLEFTSGMMGQHLEIPLLLGGGQDFFGLARIEFRSVLPPHNAPVTHETQMVFAKFAPVGQSEGGSTGVTARLSADGETIELTAPDAPAQTHRRAEIAGRTFRIGDATVEIGGYWPDFKIVDGQPATVSTQPNNPAVLIRIFGPARPADGKRARPLLELAPAADGGLKYQISRAETISTSGEARIGQPFALGWADWKATVKELLPRAVLTSTFAPGPKDAAGDPGFRARLRAPDGSEGPPQWIQAGGLLTLTWHDIAVRVGYGLELRPVPFSIGLKNFEVPRQEGTDSPSNFIATVEFRDAKTGAIKGGVAEMNHPASWPGTAFAVTTGLNYKFSQAAWDPQDLGQTTLQVLYDPGWLLKWTGSLAICIGIFIMFYLRPKKS